MSGWSLLDNEEFQETQARVDALEAGALSEPVLEASAQAYKRLEDLTERVNDLGTWGAPRSQGPGPSAQHKLGPKSIVDSHIIANLNPFTDDKSAFRQWGANMVNAMGHLWPGCG